MRRLLPRLTLSALLAAALAALPGCASAPAGGAPRQGAYTETISSVLFSQDEQHVVVIGRGHHYIFGAPPLVVQAVRSPQHGQLQVAFSTFHVDAAGDIAGDVRLAVGAQAPEAARQAAQAIGLQRQPDGSWQATATMRGHRYPGWTYRVGLAQDQLAQAHTIEITSDLSTSDAVKDSIATPLRLGADGVQLIYYAPLAPIILPVLFLLHAQDH